MNDLRNILRLAWADYANERLISVSFVLALSAVLTPLLVLFGLKYGVVSTMVGRLVEDPRNREIIPIGGGRFDAAWFAQMAKRPDVAFVLPRTRSIAASIDLRPTGASQDTPVVRADLVPTAPGDPILEKWATVPKDNDTVVVSEVVANRLRVERGAQLDGSIGRIRNGNPEEGHLQLAVAAVLPDSVTEQPAVYVPLPVLVSFEDFRDGRAVPERGWPGDPAPDEPRIFSSFRLFARSINDVAALRDELTGQGLNVDTRAEEIENVRHLDSNLTLIYRIVAGLGSAGFIIGFGANLYSTVERKRQPLSALRLVGFTPLGVTIFQMSQACATAVLGTLVSALLYEAAQTVINLRFGTTLFTGEMVCRLKLVHLAAAGLLTLAAAIVASTFAGIRAGRIEPAEGLRNV